MTAMLSLNDIRIKQCTQQNIYQRLRILNFFFFRLSFDILHQCSVCHFFKCFSPMKRVQVCKTP